MEVRYLMVGDIVNWAGIHHEVIDLHRGKDAMAVSLIKVERTPDAVVAWGYDDDIEVITSARDE